MDDVNICFQVVQTLSLVSWSEPFVNDLKSCFRKTIGNVKKKPEMQEHTKELKEVKGGKREVKGGKKEYRN